MSQGSSRRGLLGTAIGAAVAMALAGLLIWSFLEGRGEATQEAQREKPVRPAIAVSHNSAGEPLITLDPELQKQADIKTIEPKITPYRRLAEAYGSVVLLQEFTDLSNTIANAKAQLAIAQAKLAASQAAFKRAQTLHANNQNISTAQFEAAEATYRADEASVQAAQVQTQNAAASAHQAWGPVLGQSLVDGTALAKDLVERRKLLVQVTLPLDVAVSEAPATASIEISTGQRIAIEFVSPATRTDPTIQGVSFFYTADAASGALPGMNVIAYLPVGQPRSGVEIPASAVVWLRGRPWIYLQVAADSFTRHEIPTTLPQPGGGYIAPALASSPAPDAGAAGDQSGAQGFPVNEPLVVNGAQVLLSQEFSTQIQGGGD